MKDQLVEKDRRTQYKLHTVNPRKGIIAVAHKFCLPVSFY